MQASGLDAGRSRIPLHELEWSGDDPSVASVGSNGVIRPRALGDVVVRVSAGGWRDDSVRLVVGPPWHETVFAETWSENFQDNWRLFGNPRPVVTEGPDAIVGFWNNGDRSRTSGAYSVAELPVGEGLGIEASISALITAPHQQKLSLALVGWIDSLAVAGWDHQTGHLPGRGVLGETRSCIVLYPDQETVRAGEIRLIVGEVSEPVNASFPVDRGEWHTVRLQIFPDGTCGVAINGRAIGRSTARVPLDASYRIWTEGVSIGSKMLVGPLEMWIGVKTDVDWGELPWPH
jgi:hypothetical protein